MTKTNSSESESWIPPSSTLEKRDGVWHPRAVSSVSYPEEGNEICFQVEDSSYWFLHRNECIQAIMDHFPPAGTFYDIGGGNGFVALGLQKKGIEVVLVEPGSGAYNAAKRGVSHVLHCALSDVGFQLLSLEAAGAFDVVEHIEDDVAFLTSIRRLLRPGGRFYCTVPAINVLWSDEDVHAGHYRRYSKSTLTDAMQKAGFEVEFLTGLFAWLTLPVFALRAIPYRLRGSRQAVLGKLQSVQADHSLSTSISGFVRKMHEWELSRLRRNRPIPFGTSLLCVARNPMT